MPLRLVLGVGFIVHGLGKFGSNPGLTGFTGMLTGLSVPAPSFFAFIVALVELLGGAFILLGLFTRCSAALVGLVMVGAILLFHIKNGGYELPFAYLAGAASLVLTGAGKWSIDEALGWDY